VAGCCEHGNNLFGFKRGGGILLSAEQQQASPKLYSMGFVIFQRLFYLLPHRHTYVCT
jgi:hypothetical protein